MVEIRVSARSLKPLRHYQVALAGLVACSLLAAAAPPAWADSPPPSSPAKGETGRMSLAGPAPGAALGSAPTRTNAAVKASPPSPLTPRLAIRGPDDQLWVQNPGGWVPYGGSLSANPAVVVVPSAAPGGPAETLFIVSGSDHSLWVRSDSSDWHPLAAFRTYTVQGPSAVVTGSPGAFTLTVAAKGSDGALWVETAPVDSNSLPSLATNQSLGGRLQDQPAVVAENGGPTFYATGADGTAWTRTAGSGWQRFGALQCFGHIAAGIAASNFEVVSCAGFDNGLWYVSNGGNGWTAPASAGGVLTEDVTVRGLSQDVAVDVSGSDSAIWESAISGAGAAPFQPTGARLLASQEPGYVLGWVPVYAQTTPLDCETASLQMALAAFRHWASQSSLLAQETPDYRSGYWQNGVLRWGNPYQLFVGNPYGSEPKYTGWGVFYPPIVGIARSHGAPNTYGGERFSPAQIYAAVAAGHPVAAWIEYHWLRPSMGYWLTYDGRNWIHYSTLEHSVTVVGITATAVLVNDPAGGSQYWVSRSTFETSWGDFNNMAVVFG